MKKLLLLTLVAIGAVQVQAVPLIPNVFVPLPGTTVALEPQLAGVVLEDWLQPFAFSAYGGTVSGTVQSRVVRSDLDGTLDFYWRVTNDANSAGAIQDLRLGSFIAPEYNANWRIDGLGDDAPDAALLFPSPPDGFINFRFYAQSSTEPGAGLTPGESSNFILMDTTAQFYGKTALYDLTNFGQTEISASFVTFAPAVAAPEPRTFALLGSGLCLLVWLQRRRPRVRGNSGSDV